jgi:hypothetical protein
VTLTLNLVGSCREPLIPLEHSAGRRCLASMRDPGGLVGMWIAAGVGFVGVLFSFLVAFFPPDQLPAGSPTLYVTLVIVGTVVFCGIPQIIYGLRRTQWVRKVQPMAKIQAAK